MGRLLSWFNRFALGVDDDKGKAEAGDKGLTQTQVDAIVQDRLARERSKYSDYEDLKKFRVEHEKQMEAASQKELEARKEYDKLKETWQKKEQDYSSIISKKDAEITDMKVSGTLMSEITKNNAYAEEAMALLKSQAVLDKDGNIRIKGRDANGIEVMDSVEEGVKKFLTQRPYLIKAASRAGSGTPPATPGNVPAGQGSDLMTLNNELMQARMRGDHKKAKELTDKVRSALTSQGART